MNSIVSISKGSFLNSIPTVPLSHLNKLAVISYQIYMQCSPLFDCLIKFFVKIRVQTSALAVLQPPPNLFPHVFMMWGGHFSDCTSPIWDFAGCLLLVFLPCFSDPAQFLARAFWLSFPGRGEQLCSPSHCPGGGMSSPGLVGASPPCPERNLNAA